MKQFVGHDLLSFNSSAPLPLNEHSALLPDEPSALEAGFVKINTVSTFLNICTQRQKPYFVPTTIPGVLEIPIHGTLCTSMQSRWFI